MRRSVSLLTVAVALLAGCGPTAYASGTRVTARGTARPSTAGSPNQQGTSAHPTRVPQQPANPAPRNLQWYLDRLPQFPPAPHPKPVTLPHAPRQAAWVSRIPTTQRVAFITIDDGWVKRPEALALLRASRTPVSLFLTVNAVKDNPGYFRGLQQSGAVIESHTVSHRRLRGMPYAEQKQEICGSSDWLGAQYGRRPTLFRPPFGEKDDDTLRAAYDCGIQAGFFWTETVDRGKVFYQTADKRIQPGDIILMHFRDAYADDFLAALTAIKASGLTPALLEDYVSAHSDGYGAGSVPVERMRSV